MLNILIRTALIYIFLILFIRITGKRQIGELEISELVTTFILSEVAALPITDPDIPLLHAIIPVVILVSLEIIISFTVTKCKLFQKMFDGSPSFIISKGELNIKEMKRQRINIDELISSLRMKDIANIKDVEYAIIEQNGKLSAFKKEDNLSFTIINDGKLYKESMKLSGLDEKSIKSILKKKGISPNDVFLMTCDSNSSEPYIVSKEKTK